MSLTSMSTRRQRRRRATASKTSVPRWRDAVTYEVYIRSFADGNGDGVGDIAGLRSRLSYLSELGVDAVWITPWYPSPMADAGYDIADYRDIDPLFGTLADAETFIEQAHAVGIRVLVDVVPNHTSDRHPWFRAALASGPGSPERSRYWFRPGRGPEGELPPNDWLSRFGGSAWTQVQDGEGRNGEWYLHLYAAEQPDLNWDNPEVREEFESILRFWLSRGVDGFRVDVAHALSKDPALPDVGYGGDDTVATRTGRIDHPHWDRDEVHEIYRVWRRIADDFEGDRTFVAEAWVADPERLARYVRREGLHTAFNFGFLQCPWDAAELRRAIDATVSAQTAVGAPPTWVLSNHDVVRHVTRYGRAETGWQDARRLYGSPIDIDLGTCRARAAALLLLALPGGAYLYQGEELGLWEVEDLPEHLIQDPALQRGGRRRDGCRVPLPWSGDQPPFGFSREDATAAPWLPQPAAWKDLTAEAQSSDPDSMLELYRAALRLRRGHPALGDGDLAWDDAPKDVLAFTRAPGFRCVVNLAATPTPLGRHQQILLASAQLQGGQLPPDSAVWLQTGGQSQAHE
jgi:alpha-glucosidase